MWSFYNPVKTFFGWGILKKIRDILPPGKALIVTGKSSTKKICADLLPLLGNIEYEIFDQVEPNPSSETTEAGIELFNKKKCAFVIGIGGGSPLDCGKAIAFLADKKMPVIDVLYKKACPNRIGLPYVAIPTTAGTGSEVTQYAIITDVKSKKKISIADPLSFPMYGIIDPALTLSMPAEVTASTGLDVLSHAIEAAWTNNNPNHISALYAIEATKLVIENLEKATNDGSNRDGREAMMRASMFGGLAISATGTTANHAISYPLTLHRGLAHGFACAMSLPAVMRFNLDTASDVLNRISRGCGLNDADDLIRAVEDLLNAVGAPTKLAEIDLKAEDLDWLSQECFSKTTDRNPKPINSNDMKKILRDFA